MQKCVRVYYYTGIWFSPKEYTVTKRVITKSGWHDSLSVTNHCHRDKPVSGLQVYISSGVPIARLDWKCLRISSGIKKWCWNLHRSQGIVSSFNQQWANEPLICAKISVQIAKLDYLDGLPIIWAFSSGMVFHTDSYNKVFAKSCS